MSVPDRPRDPLTRTFPRDQLIPSLAAAMTRAERSSSSVASVLVDLDHFKSINDAFGHLRGDEVLQEFGSRLEECLPEGAEAFRYGGDEFVVILPGAALEEAKRFSDALLNRVASRPFPGTPSLSVSLSIGSAVYPDDAVDAESIFARMDERLYEAKRGGRGRAVTQEVRSSGAIDEAQQRMIGQDGAMQALHGFLHDLRSSGRGVLRVDAERGAGATRFLEEVRTAGRILGFEVVLVRGRPGTRLRVLASLREAEVDFGTSAVLTQKVERSSSLIAALLTERQRQGLLILVDEESMLDDESRRCLERLFAGTEIARVGMVYSTSAGEWDLAPWRGGAVVKGRTELLPLSAGGMRTLTRQALRWEAPDEFLSWLHRIAEGRPGRVFELLRRLVAARLIVRDEQGWLLEPDLLRMEAGSLPPAAPTRKLPTPSQPLVGRDREMQEIRELLRTHRHVTLLGPGGAGKTRLSLQIAAERAEDYASGVAFVSLAPLESSSFLVSSIGQALGIGFQGGSDPEARLLEYLREKELLLVLDNFEHVVEGAPLVTRILDAAPRVRVLVTSRERLRLYGETVYEIGGMAAPVSETVPDVEDYPAVQLLLRRAQSYAPELRLTRENQAAALRIIRSIGGLPLAIELAAALLRMLPLPEIADQLERSLDVLADDSRERPDRHRSLRALFDYSWVLLPEQEQRVLSSLGAFQGGFSLEAAAHVSGATLPILLSLVDKSLLRRGESQRFEIHKVYASYALEYLAGDPQRDRAVRDRHCAYYASFVRERETALQGGATGTTLAEVAEEIDNIRAAWRWASGQADAGALAALRRGLARFYDLNGWYREGEVLFGLAACSVPGDVRLTALFLCKQASFHSSMANPAVADRLARRSLEMLAGAGSELDRAEPLAVLAHVALQRGQYARAENLFRRSLRLCRQAGDTHTGAICLNAMGAIAVAQGEFDRAEKMFRQSLGLRSRGGDSMGVAKCLNNLGSVADSRNRPTEARSFFRQSLQLSREGGDRLSMALALHNLGVLTRREAESANAPEQMREAERLLLESLNTYRDIGSRGTITLCLYNLADLATWRGDVVEARTRYAEALRLAQEAEQLPLQLTVALGIARLLLRVGRGANAYRLFHAVGHHPAATEEARRSALVERELLRPTLAPAEAERLQTLAGDQTLVEVLTAALHDLPLEPGGSATPAAEDQAPEGTVAELMQAAREAEQAGDRGLAQLRLEAALSRIRTPEEGALATEIARSLGRLSFQEGDSDTATDRFELALALAELHGNRKAAAHAINNLATVTQHHGELDDAVRLYQQAVEAAQEAGETQLLAMIDQNLGTVANIRGDFESARFHYHASLQRYRALEMKEYAGFVLNNLGMLHTDVGQWEEALKHYAEALELAEHTENVGAQIVVHVNVAEMWIQRRDYQTAKKACDVAFELVHRFGDFRSLGELHKFFGVLARETGDLSGGELHLERASDIARERRDLLLAAEVSREQADLFRRLGRNRDTLRALNRSHRYFTQLRARQDLSDVVSRLQELETGFLAIVRQWGESIESADQYTQGHCERVADYACALARAVGFDERTLFWFRMGALLHDVGKIIVPPEVLNKPGKLTDEERALIERHPDAGVELLSDIEFPWDVRPMIRFHHEQWSGGGYPTGIAGEQIPLAARILCIADVFDALSSDRPYRAAFSWEKSLEIMGTSMRHHFDPDLFQIWERLVADQSLEPAALSGVQAAA